MTWQMCFQRRNQTHYHHTVTMTMGLNWRETKQYQRALAGKENALGPDHMSTLNTVDNLRNLYRRQGKLKEA